MSLVLCVSGQSRNIRIVRWFDRMGRILGSRDHIWICAIQAVSESPPELTEETAYLSAPGTRSQCVCDSTVEARAGPVSCFGW